MVNNRELAEDLHQETWVKVFRQLHQFDRSKNFYTWAKRIAINTCIDAQNKRGVDFENWEELPQQVSDDTEAVDYWQDVEWNVERVNQAVNQLPNGYREVFCLYAMEGYDHSEIAEILSIQPQTSKSQYSRAKQKIKKTLMSMQWTN
jgi:RNA polymerase sigma-70 factor (ECF subfamily)